MNKMEDNIGKVSTIYGSLTGKSLVEKNDHSGKVWGKMKRIHPWGLAMILNNRVKYSQTLSLIEITLKHLLERHLYNYSVLEQLATVVSTTCY